MQINQGNAAPEVAFEDDRTVVARAIQDGRRVLVRRFKTEYPAAIDLAKLSYGADVSQSLDFPGVLAVLGVDRERHALSLVTEDFGGRPLRALLDEADFEIPATLHIARELAKILGELHRRRVVHKDVQPANIYVDRASLEVKLANFDIASRLSTETQALVSPGRIEGDLAYVSPEQTGRMNRAVDYRSDFYSLGVTLYELLTGRLPFRATDPLELIHAHIATLPEEPILLRANVPQAVSDVVMKLLAKNAEDRYQSAYGLTLDLEECLRQLRADGTIKGLVPGEHDVSQSFQIPQKLYGREREVEVLTSAFERVSHGRAEAVLVSGYSGIGKSALVNELQRSIVELHGYYAEGKFNLQTNVPYAALIEAFQDLLRQILTESEERVATFRGQLRDALGGVAQVLVELIPEVALLLGEQPPAPALGPTESQARFNLIVQRFIDVFARAEHPLVLFFDDLQWADSASIGLLQTLLRDPQSKHLLVIGAYRDNEVHAAHPWMLALAEIKKGPIHVSEISLRPLGAGDVKRMIDDTLGLKDQDEARPFAELCSRKTEGNPFFLKQFLTSLHARELLIFDPDHGRFRWSLDRIRDEAITDNVAGLMATRLGKLRPATQEALRLAACIGSRFDLRTLAVVSQRRARKLAADLFDALQEGLIIPLGESYKYIPRDDEETPSNRGFAIEYAFSHDRVQEAAYAQISEDSRKKVHLAIGRLLLAGTAESAREARIFDITDQLDIGADLIESSEERVSLAHLNLVAGKRARASTAYASARRYLSTGIDLLGDSRWESAYEDCFELHRHRSECDYLLGHFDEADRGFDEILSRARTAVDKRLLYRSKMALALSRGRHEESMKAGDEGLKLFGIEMPSTPEGLGAAIGAEMGAVMSRLPVVGIGSLAEAPLVTDPEEKARAVFLYEALVQGSYLVPPRFALLAAMLVHHALDHGASSSCGGFVPFGMVLGGGPGDYASAYELGRVGLQVSERIEDQSVKPVLHFGFGAYLSPWRKHIRTSFGHLEQSYVGCLEVGSLPYAASSALMTVWLRFMAGDELYGLDERAERYFGYLRRLGMDQFAQGIAIPQRAAMLLTQGSLPEARRDWLDQDKALARLEGWFPGVSVFHIFALITAFVLDDQAGALAADQKAGETLAASFGHILEAEYRYYHCLLHAGLPAAATTEEQDKRLADLDENCAKLARWAEGCPENFGHKHLLVAAELCRVRGDDLGAMALYDRAIESAAENEYVQAQAIGSELAARFHLARGRRRIARGYAADARHAYARWGADAKLRLLDLRFAELRLDEVGRAPGGASGSSSAGLELSTVMKASQAISGEIVLTELLRKLMVTVLENAGAQRGILVVLGDPELVVDAGVGVPGGVVVREESIESRTDLAGSIVRYVERTLESVVLGDASVSAFRSDPYVASARPKSILCMPIIKQKTLVGVLYLENNLAQSAFTPERREVLELLSAQAAISIENARLYATLDQRVKERTRELSHSNEELSQTLRRLKETQKQLIVQEKLASLGALTAGIAHELRNPLNFVNNFAELSVSLVTDITDGLRSQRAQVDPDTLADLEDALGDLRQNVAKINEHGKRADSIINGMLIHSRETTGAREETDLNALVQDCVDLAYHGMRGKDPSFNIGIRVEYDAGVGVIGLNPQDISRVFINVINNACYATHQKQRQMVGEPYAPILTVRTRSLGDRVEVRIHDNGTGIPPEVVSKIYHPFFTTKPTGEGTGLGLSLSHDIVVQGHQGEMQVDTVVGEFTEFAIVLPKRAAAPSPASAS